MKYSRSRQGLNKINKVLKRKASTDEAKSREDNDTSLCIEEHSIIINPQKNVHHNLCVK